MRRFDRFDRIALTALTGLAIALLVVSLWANRISHHSEENGPWLIYLTSGDESTQFWQLEWKTRRAQKLAQLPGSVLQYAITANGDQIVCPVQRTDGGHDLWLVNINHKQAHRWQSCAPDDCTGAIWSPDGQGAVYTRLTSGKSSLWWIDATSGDTQPLFPDDALQRQQAAWSPDGLWLAYIDPTGQACAVTLSGKDRLCIPVMMESNPVWSPDAKTLLVTDMRFGTGFASHILQIDVASGQYLDLSDHFNTEDDAPTFSPNGKWIAFRRRVPGVAMGKQLWVMRADGSDAHALTAEPAHHYGPPVWTTDNDTMLAARYAKDGTNGIWSISIAKGTMRLIVPHAYQPRWLTR